MGDEVLHIELRRWADILVIAPLSANTLAKVNEREVSADDSNKISRGSCALSLSLLATSSGGGGPV